MQQHLNIIINLPIGLFKKNIRCLRIQKVPGDSSGAQTTFCPFAFRRKVIPNTSEARRHISIRPRKISK